MILREYQNRAVDAIFSEWEDNDSTLLVLPTGCGKTICFAEVIRRLPPGKRAMVIAHREELIWQAAQKIEAVTKLPCEVEMADFQADRGMFARAPVVVATVQTLNAGAGDGRIAKFNPNDFAALIVDEAHHCHIPGTLVSTASGAIPIENINVGDCVLGFDGSNVESFAVVNKFAYWYDGPVIDIVSSCGNRVVTTPNHKMFTANGKQYADSIKTNDILLSLVSMAGRSCVRNSNAHALVASGNEALPEMLASVSGSRHQATHSSAQVRSDTLPRLRQALSEVKVWWASFIETFRQQVLFAGIAQEVCGDTRCKSILSPLPLEPNEEKQSDADGCRERENAGIHQGRCGTKTSASIREQSNAWQWWNADEGGSEAIEVLQGCSLESSNRAEGRGDAVSLQNRHCFPGSENRRGSGRIVPQYSIEKESRSSQRQKVIVDRMEDSSLSELGCIVGSDPARLVSTRHYRGWVYDIEVESVHNYFANGLLSSNSTASSYRHVLNHFRRNPDCKILGVTATPDRSDEEALGQMFDSVAFDYEISDAITDAWLVPIAQRQVFVEGLDLSSVRTTAGDLNEGDLARIMEFEQNLHEVAAPAFDLAAGRKALVFAASVAHAERLCEIFNRHKSECAKWVCGKTPKDERRKMFAAYARGDLQFMVNVGVLTEGFDDPGVQVVVMARPTKSRALYAQMVGRGTRALPGVVDPWPTAPERSASIASSGKPVCEVIDFVGNCGKHKLVSVADILGGNYSDDIVERAKRTAKEGMARNVLDDLKAAAEAARQEQEEEQRRQAARRAELRVKANYSTSSTDPFDVFHIGNVVERGWDKGKQPSEKMLAMLEKQGIKTDGMNYAQVARLCKEVIGRFRGNQCSYRQARVLSKYGYPTDVSRKEASAIIDAIAANGWRDPNAKAELIKTY